MHITAFIVYKHKQTLTCDSQACQPKKNFQNLGLVFLEYLGPTCLAHEAIRCQPHLAPICDGLELGSNRPPTKAKQRWSVSVNKNLD